MQATATRCARAAWSSYSRGCTRVTGSAAPPATGESPTRCNRGGQDVAGLRAHPERVLIGWETARPAFSTFAATSCATQREPGAVSSVLYMTKLLLRRRTLPFGTGRTPTPNGDRRGTQVPNQPARHHQPPVRTPLQRTRG